MKKNMVKVERKTKKKKQNKLSAGLKTAIGVLGGLAATTGLINKTPAGKINVAQADMTGSSGDGTGSAGSGDGAGVGMGEGGGEAGGGNQSSGMDGFGAGMSGNTAAGTYGTADGGFVTVFSDGSSATMNSSGSVISAAASDGSPVNVATAPTFFGSINTYNAAYQNGDPNAFNSLQANLGAWLANLNSGNTPPSTNSDVVGPVGSGPGPVTVAPISIGDPNAWYNQWNLTDPTKQVTDAFVWLFGRAPTAAELNQYTRGDMRANLRAIDTLSRGTRTVVGVNPVPPPAAPAPATAAPPTAAPPTENTIVSLPTDVTPPTENTIVSLPTDVTPPTVSFSLTNGATVSGILNGSVSVSDDRGNINRVVFSIDGETFSTTDNASYRFTLNTAKYSNGAHTLKAVAYDAVGNSGEQSITIDINNIDSQAVQTTETGGDATVSALQAENEQLRLQLKALQDQIAALQTQLRVYQEGQSTARAQTYIAPVTFSSPAAEAEFNRLKTDPTFAGGSSYARVPNGIIDLLTGQIVLPASELNYTTTAPTTSSVRPVMADTDTVTAAGTTYTVRKGDTLWGISKSYYGSGNQWRRIYNANMDKIQDPNLIYPGQEFNIPPAA